MPSDAWFQKLILRFQATAAPGNGYDCLRFKRQALVLSISQAVTIVLAEYFGVDRQVDQLSLGEVATLAQVPLAPEQGLSNLESVDRRFKN